MYYALGSTVMVFYCAYLKLVRNSCEVHNTFSDTSADLIL